MNDNAYKRRERCITIGAVPLDPDDLATEELGDPPEHTALSKVKRWYSRYIEQQFKRATEIPQQYRGKSITHFDYTLALSCWPEETPCSIVVHGYRPETDAERHHRIQRHEAKQQREQQVEKKQRQHELRLLAELKAKYEPEDAG